MEPGISELNSLATQILSLDTGAAELPELLEHYLSKFSLWLDQYKGGAVEVSENELLDLNEKHVSVLRKAEDALRGARESLKGLKQREKGLRSYIDVLPKSISRTKPKKG